MVQVVVVGSPCRESHEMGGGIGEVVRSFERADIDSFGMARLADKPLHVGLVFTLDNNVAVLHLVFNVGIHGSWLGLQYLLHSGGGVVVFIAELFGDFIIKRSRFFDEPHSENLNGLAESIGVGNISRYLRAGRFFHEE